MCWKIPSEPNAARKQPPRTPDLLRLDFFGVVGSRWLFSVRDSWVCAFTPRLEEKKLTAGGANSNLLGSEPRPVVLLCSLVCHKCSK